MFVCYSKAKATKDFLSDSLVIATSSILINTPMCYSSYLVCLDSDIEEDEEEEVGTTDKAIYESEETQQY